MSYSKQVYDKALAALAQRRASTSRNARQRRAEVHARLPQTALLEREMAEQAAGVARLVIADPQNADRRIEELARHNQALQQRRQELLVGAGYPADYLEEIFECPHCKDCGYIGPSMCDCMALLLRRQAAASLGRYTPKECTFESFSLDYYDDGEPRERMRDKLLFCRRWAEGFYPGRESLLLAGPCGVGKTHLSVAMASRVSQAGFSVVYAPVQRMMDALEGEKFARDSASRERHQGATDTYLDCELLVLDDLGTEFSSQFTASALFGIINTRLVEERSTVISTNLEIAEVKSRYTQRMSSRLVYGYKVLSFEGKDIRYLKKMESR